MRVSTTDLRAATALILDHLEGAGFSEIEIEDDYYWDIAADERYGKYETPKNLVLGQLTDDWNAISLILSRQRPPIGLSLVWLAAVMRRVGEKVVR
jgi:hypothetical protein